MNTIILEEVARKVSRELLAIGAVQVRPDKPFRYASGILSPVYTDNRLLISYPKSWKRIIDGYSRLITATIGLSGFDVISGTATAGIPHAAVLAAQLKKPMIYVRSSKKDHGKENMIEGLVTKGSRVLIIEDLVSTGKSSIESLQAIRSVGGVVNTCLAITTSNRSAFASHFVDAQVALHTLTTIDITLDTARHMGRISEDEYRIVEQFLIDPTGWEEWYGRRISD